MEQQIGLLRYPGSKNQRLGEWIIEHFPADYKDMTYLEPYFGSGGVFFNKEPSLIETINDINGEVTNFFKQIRENSEKLIYAVKNTPWSRDEYTLSYEPCENELEQARRFLVHMWFTQGRHVINAKNGMRMLKNDHRRTCTYNFYEKLPQSIEAACERFRHSTRNIVQIENDDALNLIKKYNEPNVLMYLDPPYKLSTRHMKLYQYEYSDADHEELLRLITESRAKIIISGYENELYEKYLQTWHKDKMQVNLESGATRTEVVWYNYSGRQLYLFPEEDF
jgi:DNA adenine methylase